MTESSRARASPSDRPRISNSGRPFSSSSWPSRTANTSATGSASRRRATKASVCAETRSSHCASSMTHISGWSAVASASRLRHCETDQEAVGAGPALCPNAVASASRCGPGRPSRRSSSGAHSWCRPAKARSTSASTPVARASAEIRRRARRRSPAVRSCRHRPPRAARDLALPRARGLDQPVQRLALVVSAAQGLIGSPAIRTAVDLEPRLSG